MRRLARWAAYDAAYAINVKGASPEEGRRLSATMGRLSGPDGRAALRGGEESPGSKGQDASQRLGGVTRRKVPQKRKLPRAKGSSSLREKS